MILAFVVLIPLVGLAVLSAVFSPGYLFRWAVWQDADVGDYARFPARPVEQADEPFTLEVPNDPAAAAASVRSALEASAPVGTDAEAFLERTGTQAFIVIRDDTVLYEGYFGGFQRDSTATSFSVAKSYVSALIGIAIQEGAIRSVDDPITDYVPELLERDERFADIRIGNLLDMTSGLRYEETGLPWGDDALTYYFDDLRALAVERTEIVEPPGERWHYVNYNPLLLGLVLERTTDTSVSDYLGSRIWSRIGTEFPASWSLDHEGGFEKMESGINARPIDFAKLGTLYLQDGSWDGERIVPEDWVAASVDPSVDGAAPVYPDSFHQPYGTISHQRYWWRIARPDGRYAFTALGNHGQLVFVVPDEDLIVVRNGREYGISSFEWFGVLLTMADELSDTEDADA
ncbi:MAG TPA: serine hydrolase [candidate division Zixibacteria bacterium]|nr:serine hydrolase [candidate division Zixibacteria bacterium]